MNADAVITTLLTRVGDPQRELQRWKPETSIFTTLAESLESDTLIVLHDEPLVGPLPGNVRPIRVTTSSVNPYFQRWFSIAEYLRHAPWERVWCVDGSDVTMLRKPWPSMTPGRIYVGHEGAELGIYWMRMNHRSRAMARFIHRHSSARAINAGVIGGDREDVRRYAQHIKDLWDENLRLQGIRLERENLGVGDMAAFNYVGHVVMSDRVEWGSHVTTVFKAYEDNGQAWWMHK